jgi:tRNA A-37 threonylcarbamoyl transferase component Bud32
VLSPGTKLATYEVRKRLAVGGMGEVYLCRHRLLDRDDAVKVLRPHLVADEAFRRRFLREALSAARLRHPHIVTVYTADEVDGQLYLAMEYIPGADLASILDRDLAIEPHRLVRLLDQVADALDAAHRLQLTHRDVKPSNVLVERPGSTDLKPGGPHGGPEHAYLVDFGLSKSANAVGDQNITMTGQVLGTVAYIAPEQLQNAVTDGRCDQYALACMTFECLTGKLPFARDTQVAVITAHLTSPPPSACDLMPSLPMAVDRVLARGMAKNPEERFPTCSEFVGALRTAIETGETTVVRAASARGGSVEARQEQAWANPASPAAAVHVDASPPPGSGRRAAPPATGRVAAHRVTPPEPVAKPPEPVAKPPMTDPALPVTVRDEPLPAAGIDPAAPPGFTLPDDTPFGHAMPHDLPPERGGNPYVRSDRPYSATPAPYVDPNAYRPQHPSPTSGGGYRPGAISGGLAYPAGAPLPAEQPANTDARLFLAVVGGPEAGRLVALPDGERSVPIGLVTLGFSVSGWAVQVTGESDSTVNGEPLHGRRQLAPGDLITAGPALLEVRSGRHLARLAPNSPPPDPVTLERVARERLAGAVRGPQHPQTLVTRIGWLGRRPPVPIAVPVGNAGGIAIRGSLAATAPLVRWLLTQAAVLHDARDLSLVVAASPWDTERWNWVSTLPHARPSTPPLNGPHVATTRDGALDLSSRLRYLVDVRRNAAADPRARQLAALPRVLAVLDDRLGARDPEFITAMGGSLGVHVVRLLQPEARLPPSCRLCVDVDPNGNALTVWVAGQSNAQTGVPDGVSTAYVREVASLLADT